ncbi:MAG: DUF1311 domain-containing protein [Hydrogenophaga sp.]|uniref:lysozyme inhibitor LprI family protein n=1 Tax=Hydrogenophaga sp. TaxID=1904254 RepID=UPI001D5D6A8F|nr:lysozyme inhibitor LprI family protein [Hydrogenophaga sp.]MBX3611793.1 DUF1311 domain-containing protein [Hydrogenophaga sp.]
MHRFAALLCLLLPLTPALATAPATTPANDLPADCAKAETQRQLTACAYRDFEHAQAGYAATFRDLSAVLDSAQRTLLRNAQTAWLQFRTTACEFEASGVRGGSAEPMVRQMCQARLTRERTAELRRHMSCPEGDVACVRPNRR